MKKFFLKALPVAGLTMFPISLASCNKPLTFPYVELENPTCIIETENKEPIEGKRFYINATYTIKNCVEGQQLISIPGQIKGRGHNSWTYPKKSYSVKFNEKQFVFGSEKDYKKWTLVSNYGDPSLYRNFVAYTLSSKLDKMTFSPAVQMVDLYLNDEYLGVYMFADRIEAKKNGRVKINTDISPDGNNGYLLEQTTEDRAEGEEDVNYIKINKNLCFELKSPDTEDEGYLPYASIECSYIKSYINQCLSALDGGVWTNVENVMDVDTFVDGYLIEELFANLDCYRFSMFYYKDKDGKLCHGPVWDFDLSSGNVNIGPGTDKTCPPDKDLWAGKKDIGGQGGNVFYVGLMKYSEFKAKVKTRLAEFKTSFNEVMELLNPNNINGYYQKAKQSIDRNFLKWNVLGNNASRCTPQDVVKINTLAGQHTFLKEWLEKRYAFLEEQFK